jgi:protein-S-isoprenylcysteine O-methyltransferase Ste14
MEEKRGEHPFGDTGQLILFVVFLLVWVGDSFLLRLSTVPAGAVPLLVRLGLSAIAGAYGFVLMRSGHVAVSEAERPVRIISTGAFGRVRHPLYLAAILLYLAFTISTLSLLSAAVVVIALVFYDYIASYEETLMERKFGEEYVHYKRRVGKWLPRIGRTM